MNRVLQAAGELQDFLVMQNWRFCVIGGLAVLHWGGRARLWLSTSVFLCPLVKNLQHIESLLTRFAIRIPEAR